MSDKKRKELEKKKRRHIEELYDESLSDSFPASDPPSQTPARGNFKIEKKRTNLK